MKSYHGKYVVAEPNGKANANRGAIGSWEIWTVTFIGDDQVQFKGAHGKYLAESDGDANEGANGLPPFFPRVTNQVVD